jgi:hypothetical protein
VTEALPLIVGAILTKGRRTVSAVLWTMRGVICGHHSTYHRVFSLAAWSLWPLGKVLASAILRLIPEDQPVLVPMAGGMATLAWPCSDLPARPDVEFSLGPTFIARSAGNSPDQAGPARRCLHPMPGNSTRANPDVPEKP